MMANPTITQEDYTAMSGPDWPSYSAYCSGDQPDFVVDEIRSMLGKTVQQQNSITNFCVLPFYGREYPADVHCCQLPADYDIDSIQQDMLQNRRNSQCSVCWRLEDAGARSDRQIKNETAVAQTNRDLYHFYEQAMQGNYATTQYKIDGGNYCNATCVTCEPGSSSSWGRLKSDWEGTRIPLVDLVREDHEKIVIDYPRAEYISFTGGESTMIRTHWNILRRLIEVGNTACQISFVTNGSFTPTEKQMAILEQFPNINFCFSIDGINRVFEYMRYPLNWETLLQNIEFAKKHGFSVSASYTISNLNILYHEQTVEWFVQNSIPYLENPVELPAYFAPSALSDTIKQEILARTNNSTVQMLLQNHSEQDQQLFERFCENVRLQDAMKKISVADYLPEMATLLTQ